MNKFFIIAALLCASAIPAHAQCSFAGQTAQIAFTATANFPDASVNMAMGENGTDLGLLFSQAMNQQATTDSYPVTFNVWPAVYGKAPNINLAFTATSAPSDTSDALLTSYSVFVSMPGVAQTQTLTATTTGADPSEGFDTLLVDIVQAIEYVAPCKAQ